MKVAVLGTGGVGRTIATKLVSLGHHVAMGSRTSNNQAAADWAARAGDNASHGSFADATADSELVFNCTSGAGSLDALRSVGTEKLAGKIVVDVANPLDFSGGFPPSLFVSGTDSLAEQIQREFPAVRVVKTLNTINHQVMVDPARAPGDHDVFLSGNDEGAKAQVRELLESFGWPRDSIVDLGDITSARGAEAYLLLWLRLLGALGTGDFNIKVVR